VRPSLMYTFVLSGGTKNRALGLNHKIKCCVVQGASMKDRFGREAVASLLKMSIATSDPKIAAALVDKAADLKQHLDDGQAKPDVAASAEGRPSTR
jgi:hypothetical protein